MRVLALLCVTVATVWLTVTADHHHHEQGGDGEMDKELREKLHQQEKDLARLTAGVVNVYDKIKHRQEAKEKADHDSRGMLHRLDRMLGGHCDEDREFSCFDTQAGECVDHLLCCDGVKDCPNGADEAAALCDLPYKVGDTWSGLFEFYDCNDEVLTDVKFRLDKVEEIPGTKGVVRIEGLLFWVDETHPDVKMYEQLPYSGLYHYGSRKADFRVLYSGQIYHEHLYFLPGHEDMMHYDIYEANTHELCGRAYMKYDGHH